MTRKAFTRIYGEPTLPAEDLVEKMRTAARRVRAEAEGYKRLMLPVPWRRLMKRAWPEDES